MWTRAHSSLKQALRTHAFRVWVSNLVTGETIWLEAGDQGDQASTAEAAAMTAMATSSTNYSTMHGVVSQQDRHEMFPVFPGSGGRPRIDVAHARCMLVCNHLVRFHEPDGYCSTVLL